MTTLPMFPLGTVLFPGGVLPLHVFEPRYREMVRACLAGDRSFGVVLIERGSEVGGGDVRTDAGTLARIAEARESDDGRWRIVAVGEARITVVEWLPDDAYPRAEVEPWDDPPAGADARAGVERALATLRRVAALRSELGEPAGTLPDALADDPVLASHQACWLSPVATIDKQRLLAAPSAEARLTMLTTLLEEEAEVLTLRLGGS